MEDRLDHRRASNGAAGSGASRVSPSPATRTRKPARPPLPTRVEGLPALPPAFSEALETGLVGLHLRLDPGQRAALEDHVRLLLAWNRAISLTTIVGPAEIAIRHVLDSLTAVELLRQRRVERLVDIGSGTGYPGLPLAVATPLAELLLVESVAKKARFLETVAAALTMGGRLRSQIRVGAGRAEAVAADPHEREAWPAAVARAVGPLGELVELAFPLLQPGGVLIAWKGRQIHAERRGAERAMLALGGGTLEVVTVGHPALAGHQLVVATRTGDVPEAYPRDPRLRQRQPW